jgi:hypothetical protein
MQSQQLMPLAVKKQKQGLPFLRPMMTRSMWRRKRKSQKQHKHRLLVLLLSSTRILY